ncbi:hypothetical protein V8C86DRAFT_2773741 [Haematococcus lacustris]
MQHKNIHLGSTLLWTYSRTASKWEQCSSARQRLCMHARKHAGHRCAYTLCHCGLPCWGGVLAIAWHVIGGLLPLQLTYVPHHLIIVLHIALEWGISGSGWQRHSMRCMSLHAHSHESGNQPCCPSAWGSRCPAPTR